MHKMRLKRVCSTLKYQTNLGPLLTLEVLGLYLLRKIENSRLPEFSLTGFIVCGELTHSPQIMVLKETQHPTVHRTL